MNARHGHKKKKHQAPNGPVQGNKDPATAIPDNDPPERNNEKIMGNSAPIYKPPDSRVAVWTLSTAIIVAAIYGFQLTAMLDSNKINRESLESVQRAFITFKAIQEERSLGRTAQSAREEHWWSIMPVVENSGTTPAEAVIDYDAINELTREPNGDTFIGDAKHFSVASFGPKDTHGMGMLNREEAFIFGQDLGDLKNVRLTPRQKPIFVWGWVAYRDIFPKTKIHITEFCSKLLNGTVMTDKSMRWVMAACDTHNCTDEYCPDYEAIAALAEQEAKKAN